MPTSGIITVLCVIFYFAYSHRKECVMPTIEEEIGVIEEPDEQTKVKMDRQYTIWKVCTIIVTCIALLESIYSNGAVRRKYMNRYQFEVLTY